MRAWNAIPPHKPSRLSTFLGKITRNLALNKYKGYNTQKRGAGQTDLVLAELEECLSTKWKGRGFGGRDGLGGCNQSISGRTAEGEQDGIRQAILVYEFYQRNLDQFAMNPNKVTTMLFRMRNDLKLHLESEEIHL